MCLLFLILELVRERSRKRSVASNNIDFCCINIVCEQYAWLDATSRCSHLACRRLASMFIFSKHFARIPPQLLTNPARRQKDGQIERASAGHHWRTPVKVDIRPAGHSAEVMQLCRPAGQAGVLVSIQSTRPTAINCTDVRRPRGRRWKSMRRPTDRHCTPTAADGPAPCRPELGREGASLARAAVDHTGGRPAPDLRVLMTSLAVWCGAHANDGYSSRFSRWASVSEVRRMRMPIERYDATLESLDWARARRATQVDRWISDHSSARPWPEIYFDGMFSPVRTAALLPFFFLIIIIIIINFIIGRQNATKYNSWHAVQRYTPWHAGQVHPTVGFSTGK